MKIFRIAAVLVLAALLTGCSGGSIYSNYRELEQLMVIQTLGFDRTSGGVRLSASSGSDSAGGGGGGDSGTEQSGSAGVARLAAEAPSFTLAEEKMQDYSAREDLFFAHTAYIAIGGASAKESLKPFLDYIERSTDLRLDIPLFVVTNGTASELVLGAAEVVSSLDENGCALITAVKSVKADKAVKEAKAAELTAIPDGFAVIKNGRTVGSVPVDCAKGVNVLQNKVGPSSVKLRVGNDTATVQLDKCACRITPMFGGGVLAGLDVKITLSAALSETTGSVGVQELNRALADEVERWVMQVLDISRSLECDFLQLGKVLERKQPQRLHGASADLSERLRDIYYNVGVEAEVDRSFDVGLGSSE